MGYEFEIPYSKEMKEIRERAEREMEPLARKQRDLIGRISDYHQTIDEWMIANGWPLSSQEGIFLAVKSLYPEVFALHERMVAIRDAADKEIESVMDRMKEDWRKLNG